MHCGHQFRWIQSRLLKLGNHVRQLDLRLSLKVQRYTEFFHHANIFIVGVWKHCIVWPCNRFKIRSNFLFLHFYKTDNLRVNVLGNKFVQRLFKILITQIHGSGNTGQICLSFHRLGQPFVIFYKGKNLFDNFTGMHIEKAVYVDIELLFDFGNSPGNCRFHHGFHLVNPFLMGLKLLFHFPGTFRITSQDIPIDSDPIVHSR